MRIVVDAGDITRAQVDAIVNAANTGMLGGGGVDGAIHRAAGPDLLEACRQVKRVNGMRCPTGEARITPGFRLPAKHVIHTVGPIYTSVPNPAELLASAYRSSLELAVANDLKSLAFPAISCGVYGYPVHEAVEVVRGVLTERRWPLDEVRFVLYTRDVYEAFRRGLQDLIGP